MIFETLLHNLIWSFFQLQVGVIGWSVYLRSFHPSIQPSIYCITHVSQSLVAWINILNKIFIWLCQVLDWCWSWISNTLATWCKELTHWERPWCWERLRAWGEEGNRGWDGRWHHQLNGHEYEQTPRRSGQGSLACCSAWDCQELDITEQLNDSKGLCGT